MRETDVALTDFCPEGVELCVKVYLTSNNSDYCAVASLDGLRQIPVAFPAPDAASVLRAAGGGVSALLEEAHEGPLRLMTETEIAEYKREND